MENVNKSGASPITRRPRVLIVGLGNDLLKDDGVGVHAVRRLKQMKLGPRVMAVEVGTAVLDALHLFERADCILAIDAMQAGGAPGTVYRMDSGSAERDERASMHDFTFHSALTLLRKQPSKVIFLGVEPGEMEFGLELTDAVEQALPVVTEAAISIVRQWQEETGKLKAS